MYVSPETIEKAREIDLLSYLKACEPYELVYNGGGMIYALLGAAVVLLRVHKETKGFKMKQLN